MHAFVDDLTISQLVENWLAIEEAVRARAAHLPRSAVALLSLEALAARPRPTVEGLLRWMGVPGWSAGDAAAAVEERSRAPFAPSSAEVLDQSTHGRGGHRAKHLGRARIARTPYRGMGGRPVPRYFGNSGNGYHLYRVPSVARPICTLLYHYRGVCRESRGPYRELRYTMSKATVDSQAPLPGQQQLLVPVIKQHSGLTTVQRRVVVAALQHAHPPSSSTHITHIWRDNQCLANPLS